MISQHRDSGQILQDACLNWLRGMTKIYQPNRVAQISFSDSMNQVFA